MHRFFWSMSLLSFLVPAGCAPPEVESAHCDEVIDQSPPMVDVTVERQRFSLPMLSLTFDDGWSGQAQAASMLDDRGLTGTFYLTSGFLDSSEEYLTTSEARIIATHGHEIGNHSRTHPDLRSLSDERLADEVAGARAALEKGLCVSNIVSVAAPFGNLDDRVAAYVAGEAESLRGVRRRQNDPDVDPMNIGSFAANTSVDGSVGETPHYFANELDDAVAENRWLVIHFHQLLDGTPKTHIEYLFSDYAAILDDVSSRVARGELAVVTVGEGVRLLGDQPVGAP